MAGMSVPPGSFFGSLLANMRNRMFGPAPQKPVDSDNQSLPPGLGVPGPLHLPEFTGLGAPAPYHAPDPSQGFSLPAWTPPAILAAPVGSGAVNAPQAGSGEPPAWVPHVNPEIARQQAMNDQAALALGQPPPALVSPHLSPLQATLANLIAVFHHGTPAVANAAMMAPVQDAERRAAAANEQARFGYEQRQRVAQDQLKNTSTLINAYLDRDSILDRMDVQLGVQAMKGQTSERIAALKGDTGFFMELAKSGMTDEPAMAILINQQMGLPMGQAQQVAHGLAIDPNTPAMINRGKLEASKAVNVQRQLADTRKMLRDPVAMKDPSQYADYMETEWRLLNPGKEPDDVQRFNWLTIAGQKSDIEKKSEATALLNNNRAAREKALTQWIGRDHAASIAAKYAYVDSTVNAARLALEKQDFAQHVESKKMALAGAKDGLTSIQQEYGVQAQVLKASVTEKEKAESDMRKYGTDPKYKVQKDQAVQQAQEAVNRIMAAGQAMIALHKQAEDLRTTVGGIGIGPSDLKEIERTDLKELNMGDLKPAITGKLGFKPLSPPAPDSRTIWQKLGVKQQDAPPGWQIHP